MEVCAGFELIAVENATALGDDVLKIGEGVEVLVGPWLVEDGPEVLGGLKLGGVWGQVDEPDPDPAQPSSVRCARTHAGTSESGLRGTKVSK